MDVLFSDHEVANITGRSRSTLQKDRLVGGGIPFVRFGRMIRYRRSDVEQYLSALPSYASTSEVGGRHSGALPVYYGSENGEAGENAEV
jgi:excisionase family DNA binding protein